MKVSADGFATLFSICHGEVKRADGAGGQDPLQLAELLGAPGLAACEF